MTSLRKRLFLILVAATGVIWLGAVAWIYVGAKAELERVLDTRLREAATMVASLAASGNMTGSADSMSEPAGYERQLSCQIWSLDGRLVARSSGAPETRLTNGAFGFSEQTIAGEPWRVYAIEDRVTGVRVMVGDRLGLRDRLVADLIKGLLAPAVLVVPLLGILIWGSLGRGLTPLYAMARELAVRGAEDMRPVDASQAPSEVRPLAEALNGLFAKVEAARHRERDVTAFAAHELRTPLAGLKTQAQIALATPDASIRDGALRQIIVSADRTARLVRQLLALAKLDAGADVRHEDTNVGEVVREIVRSCESPSCLVSVEIDTALDGLILHTDRASLMLVLRNLHENAVYHMPNGGTVRWGTTPEGQGAMVDDEGPGIPEDELPFATQRFFRGRHKSATGTGLGLAIAELAAREIGATLILRNRPGSSGLTASIVMRRANLATTSGATATGATCAVTAPRL